MFCDMSVVPTERMRDMCELVFAFLSSDHHLSKIFLQAQNTAS